METLLDDLADGVVAADADGTVTAVNSVAAAMFGTDAGTGAERGVGRPLAEVLTLLDRDGVAWLDHNQPFAGPRSRRGIPEQAWILPNGDEVLTKARIVRDGPRGAITRIVVSIRDGRGRERLDRDRSDLVATVAHELRSPLTGVKGFVQALLNRWEKLDDAQRRLMLETVYADSERLARLITELLDVARLDTGRLQMYPRPVDAVALTRAVAESVRAGTATPIEVLVPDPAVHPLPEIRADSDKFTQVLTNLVENAVRHGEGTVQVVLEPGPDDQVRIVVSDEGPGIPEEMRQRVFTKFWTTGGSGGSGLGMYLVNGLARAHGGSLVIADSPRGGAEITLHWPAALD